MALTIGICGGSASGKTTFANELAETLGNSNCTILSLDSYYIDLTGKNLDPSTVNYDDPTSFDFDLFASHIKLLKSGHFVRSPIYDFTAHKRLSQTREVSSSAYLLIEGLFLFTLPVLTGLFDKKVFIDAPDDVRLARRIRRDAEERNRKLQSILDQYSMHVRPMHYKYVEPNKKLAQVSIDGVKPFSDQIPPLIDSLIGISGSK